METMTSTMKPQACWRIRGEILCSAAAKCSNAFVSGSQTIPTYAVPGIKEFSFLICARPGRHYGIASTPPPRMLKTPPQKKHQSRQPQNNINIGPQGCSLRHIGARACVLPRCTLHGDSLNPSSLHAASAKAALPGMAQGTRTQMPPDDQGSAPKLFILVSTQKRSRVATTWNRGGSVYQKQEHFPKL